MKKIEYICDMCECKRPIEEITGFYYQGGTNQNQYRLDKNKIEECKTHICIRCITVIRGLLIDKIQ